jgi:hypothetical protein
MRTLHLMICMALGVSFVEKNADASSVTNGANGSVKIAVGESGFANKQKSRPTLNWAADTNGLSCTVVLSYFYPEPKVRPPVCFVNGINESTNLVRGLNMPPTNLFSIELFDPNGKPVERTAEGKMFGLPLTQKQIEDWCNKMTKRRWRNGLFYLSKNTPPPGVSISGFSIPQAFQIRNPGEYTLRLRMRLIQLRMDASGHRYFPVGWLPEVVAKVQIRPEDIPKPE